MPDTDTLARFAAVVGARCALSDGMDMQKYLVERRDKYFGKAAMVLRPGSTAEVSQILAIAHETGTGIVPQSGNTGLVGGQIPDDSGREVVVSLDRMNTVRGADATENTITVDGGVTLQAVHEAAEAIDRQFPLHLASQGSCMIGGNLASNAGGIGVLAYGNARDLCLGLEVVLADGRVWDGLRRLRKDNTGYDLKDVFIGSEGTLGVITGAVLRLFARPRDVALAFAAVDTPADGLRLLELARQATSGQVTACELVPRIGVEFTMRHAGARDPLDAPSPWYVMLELSSALPGGRLAGEMEAALADAFERGVVGDATIAASQGQMDALWHIRESLSDVQKLEGGSIKHDVAVPVALTPLLIDEATAVVERLVPGARPVPFGHLGDGNIHFNVSQPAGADKAAFLARWEEINAAVHEVVLRLGGTISAEHGIGQMKRDLMPGIKSAVELDLMRSLKQALDPRGILNPHKLLPEAE
jgi:FAD/FMN-containing dehydrogenase